MCSIPGFFSLSDETLNRDPIIISQDKLPTRTYCDDVGDYAVPDVLSASCRVFLYENVSYCAFYLFSLALNA